MALWWLPAAANAVKSVGSYLAARKSQPGRFRDTPRGGYLARVSKEGEYSPAMRGSILSGVGVAAGQTAQQARARTRGYLAARGLSPGSVAGASALNAPALEQMRRVDDANREVTINNEASKVRAAEDLAREGTEWNGMRREYMTRNTTGLLGGLADAGISAVQGYTRNRYETRKKADLELVQKKIDAGDKVGAMNLLLMLQAKYGD